jgi:hypothetical protein
VAPRSSSTPKLTLAAEALLKFAEIHARLESDIEEEQVFTECLPCAVLSLQLRVRGARGLYVGQQYL